MITQEGFDYRFDPQACATCGGRCCTGSGGYIWVARQKIGEIARYLDITPETLMQRYLQKVGYRLTIREEEVRPGSFACVFFDAQKGCLIYPVRPVQCKSFPFWDRFKQHPEELKAECPGVSFPAS